MSPSVASAVASGLLVALAAGATAADPPRGPVKLRLIPPQSHLDPWLAVTDGTAAAVLGDNPEVLPALSLTITGVDVQAGRNTSVKVFANTLRATAETLPDDTHFVGRGHFFPADSTGQGFTMDPTPALRRLAKAGNLRLDRPLVFALVLAPGSGNEAFRFKDWAVEAVTLSVEGK